MKNQPDFQKILQLLQANADNDFAKNALASYIASKAFESGHLYSDMGMSSRIELNKLMSENYNTLAARRPPEIRWKKFLFDEIGSMAPACHDCKDLQSCFKCNVLEGG